MKLTEHFSHYEMTHNKWANEEQQEQSDSLVNDGVLVNLIELCENLEVLREKLGKPISISIAFRPLFWELLKGRSGKSQHTKGKAADIKVPGLTPSEVADWIEILIKEGKMKQGGLKAYKTFVHYDTRGKKARW